MSTQTDHPPKKKRRQNVACDSCKLRRIKCDLLNLLTSLDGLSAPNEDEPAHLSVRRYPGHTCTQCRSKGLQCSTEGILNPLKPNKGGKRIDEARQRFGGESAVATPAHDYSKDKEINGGREWMKGPEYDGLLDQLGIEPFATADTGASTFEPVHSGFTGVRASNSQTFEPSITTSANFGDQPSDALFRSILQNIDGFPSAGDIPLNGHATAYPTPLSRTTPETQRQALEVWDRLSANTPQTIANRSLRHSISTSRAESVNLDAHTPHPNTLVPALGRLDIETNTFLPILPLDSHQTPARADANTGETYGAHSGRTDMVRHGADGSVHSSVGQSGKRQRTYDSAGSSPSSSASARLQPWERDPWHIWQPKDESESHAVAWSRKEQVQESLADKALGIELSRHLITVYFQAVHFSLPVLSPESFYSEWESCGRRADRMSPAQEALCAVLEAWASRYSDNPAILGLPYQQAHTSPKVITEEGQFMPGSKGRAHWGKARLPVCNALLDRAGRVIDAASLLRRPSVTGLQALSLYNQLMHMSDQGSRVKDQWIQNIIVHSTIIEQMKLLQMFWTTGDPILTSEESNQDTLQLRMKQRRLFWTTAVADACWASATGLAPKMPEEELSAGRAWVDEVMDNLPDSTMKLLAFFMKVWHRLAMVGRKIALEVTKYNDKKGNIPVSIFCTSIQQCWGEIRSIVTELTESVLGLLGACEPGVLGFSPLNYITNMRLSCPFFLLVLHEAIRNHLAFRQSFYSSYVIDPESEDAAAYQRDEDLGMLNKIHLQSVDVLLYNCRSQMNMIKDLLPTGIIQSASIMIRVLIASGQFMAEVPTNEQMYPASTLGGYDWTWEEKQRCIAICTDALYQIVSLLTHEYHQDDIKGWAWSDVTEVLNAIDLSMERMTPSPDILATYHGRRESINVKIQLQRSREMKIEHDGVQAALRFWPPKSIPSIIGTTKQDDLDHVSDVPNTDMERRQRLPHKERQHDGRQSAPLSFQSTTTSVSATPSIYMATSAGPSSISNTSSEEHHVRVDESLTNTVPGFGYLGQNPVSNSTSSYPPPAGLSAQNESASLWQERIDMPSGTADGSEDQSFWDLMNGGTVEDLDFSAFLQNFNGDGSAI